MKICLGKGDDFTVQIEYINANKNDTELLVNIYNAAFYSDYIKYGECPAYGRSVQSMEKSIELYPKTIILCDKKPVGAISVQNKGNGNYYIGCLCIIPEYQGRGIGTQAFRYIQSVYSDWKMITLMTPSDKNENIKFYTQKCGFSIGEKSMDGNVEVINFYINR